MQELQTCDYYSLKQFVFCVADLYGLIYGAISAARRYTVKNV